MRAVTDGKRRDGKLDMRSRRRRVVSEGSQPVEAKLSEQIRMHGIEFTHSTVQKL